MSLPAVGAFLTAGLAALILLLMRVKDSHFYQGVGVAISGPASG